MVRCLSFASPTAVAPRLCSAWIALSWRARVGSVARSVTFRERERPMQSATEAPRAARRVVHDGRSAGDGPPGSERSANGSLHPNRGAWNDRQVGRSRRSLPTEGAREPIRSSRRTDACGLAAREPRRCRLHGGGDPVSRGASRGTHRRPAARRVPRTEDAGPTLRGDEDRGRPVRCVSELVYAGGNDSGHSQAQEDLTHPFHVSPSSSRFIRSRSRRVRAVMDSVRSRGNVADPLYQDPPFR
jgi:hypothetical protein